MKKTLFIFILLLVAGSFSTCKKGDSVGGSSSGVVTIKGNVTLVVDITHHSWGVPFIPVYIMLNTTDWPGRDSALYNLNGVTDEYGYVEFDNFVPEILKFIPADGIPSGGGYVLGYNNFSITKADANNTVYDNVVVSEKF